MKATSFFALIVVACAGAGAHAKLVACVGDSITYGSGISDRMNNSYPAQLERLLQQHDVTWEVANFGVSGATMLHRGDRPYIQESAYVSARSSQPDVVIIKLGTNDSKPHNWQYKDDFISDYSAMIDVFRSLPSRPEVWICKPVPAFRVNFSISPDVIRDEILPMIDQIASEKDVPIIDLFTALSGMEHLFPDAIHPNAEGAGVMAETIAPLLLGVRFMPDFNRDGVLNFVDFAHLAMRWQQEAPSLDVAPPPDGDAWIAYADLLGLGRYWMQYPGLVAHWQFDAAAGALVAERLGRFDGSAQGGPVWRPAGGQIGGALELDGVDDYVSTDNVLNPGDGPFSVFAWIKGGQPGQVIVSQSNESRLGQVWLGTDGATGALITGVTDGGRLTGHLVSATDVTDDTWHRVRLVWDGTLRYLYVDGQQVAVDTRALSKLKFANAGFVFGAGKDLEEGSFWRGLIDEVRFYNRAVKP